MMRTVRFLTGLVMVVTGVSMAAPMATRLVEAHVDAPRQADMDGAVAAPPLAAAVWAGVGPSSGATGVGGYCIPDPRAATPSDGGLPVLPDAAGGASPPPDPSAPAAAYQPPPPPDLLPALPADLSLAPPSFNATYRSTLDVPPPPLLDVTAPAPLAVSTSGPDRLTAVAGPMGGSGAIHTVSATVAPGGGPVPTSQAVFSMPAGVASSTAVSAPPSTYTIRDGDDLTSIASRLYGHPGAAEAIWSANRDRLPDPTVLPIGLALRVPPTWVPPAARDRGPGGEPPPIEPARRPARVRVAPGESLESLAQRFYGERSMAVRLWEANRDLLRSPSLLVPGMELRLP